MIRSDPAPHIFRKVSYRRLRGAPLVLVLGGLWLLGAAGGLGMLASYATSAPSVSAGPRTWPSESGLPREAGATSLVMFLHPKCPCSSASLGELNRMIARMPETTRVTLAFYAPTSESSDWGATSLRRYAESLPRVRVVDDVDAREAKLFGAVNSGHVVVYGPDGALRYEGGITASRGHEGDNLGEDCAMAALAGKPVPSANIPAFGCEISPTNSSAKCPLCPQETSR